MGPRIALLALAFLLPLAWCKVHITPDIQEKFSSFEKKFNKNYLNPEERTKRLQVFAQNLREIERHNADKTQTWKKGINKFADLTRHEFKQMYTSGYINFDMKSGSKASSRSLNPQEFGKLPETADWRLNGSITPVKDQGQCGSCVAHAAVSTIESYLHINSGELKVLSTQQATSCVQNPMHCGGYGGCFGSMAQLVMGYTELFGLTLDEDYPYVSGETEQTEDCAFDAVKHLAHAFNRGHETLPHNDRTALMNHLAFKGPLSAVVAASDFHLYESGLFDACDYDDEVILNHAIQLVGYGVDEELGDYWLVRNSWGESWGESGYIRLKREEETICGTDLTLLGGGSCEGDGQVYQKVCGMCGILYDTVYPIDVSPDSGRQ